MALDSDTLDLVWGVEEIGKLIGRNYQQTFYMIRGGKLPAVRKIGERYVASRSKLAAYFTQDGPEAAETKTATEAGATIAVD